MVCYAEKPNQIESAEGKSGAIPFCVTTSAGFFIGDDMKTIPLILNKRALVDDEDYNKLRQHKWYLSNIFNLFYAVRHTKCIKGERGLVYMHRQILKAKKGAMIDHCNHNGLDNQKHNLRFCTNSTNQANSKKATNNTSGYRGVGWHKQEEKWTVRIRVNGKLRHIGYFDNLIEAAKAYDNEAVKYFGEFAYRNF